LSLLFLTMLVYDLDWVRLLLLRAGSGDALGPIVSGLQEVQVMRSALGRLAALEGPPARHPWLDRLLLYRGQ
jgi:hypothetical protein